MQLIDRLGFDAVDAGPLQAGLALEPDGAAFGVAHSADELANLLRPRRPDMEALERDSR
jgi:predicted dinucleotide-binding enzyme